MALNETQLLHCYHQLHRIFPEDLHIARPLIRFLKDQGEIRTAQDIALATARRMLAAGKSTYAMAFLSLCEQLDHPDREEIASLFDMARISQANHDSAQNNSRVFPLIEQLSDDESLDFIRQGTLCRAESGVEIVRQGDNSKTFYLILDGKVDIRIQRSDGVTTTINQMQASNFFGEFACLYRLRRSASVVTTAPSLLLEFSDQSIAALLEQSPMAGDYLMRTVKNRLVHAMTFNLPAFADIPDEDRLWLADASTVDEYQTGDTIPSCHPGTPSCDIILTGSATLEIQSSLNGDKRTVPLPTGAIFGDADACIRTPRQSRIVANERTLICRMPAHIFTSFLQLYHCFEQQITRAHAA